MKIQQRQIQIWIINTVNIINKKLKSSIEETEQRIKNLQYGIDKSKGRLLNISENCIKLKA